MKWYNDLYFGEGLAPKADQIVKKIKKNQVIPNVYLIALASNPENMLDIIPEWELMQKAYPKEHIQVIGIAKGKRGAIGLVQYIVEESLEKTGSADVRAYLKEKWEGQV